MLLSEPPRSPYDWHFSVLGIPVRVHPFFWLVSLVLGLTGSTAEPMNMLLWVLVVFVSILVHEMGHALAIRAHGWEPWITLYGMGGLASYRATRRTARSDILIALAGPIAGFAFAAFIVTAIIATRHEVAFDWRWLPGVPVRFELFDNRQLNLLIFYLLEVNIFWGLINLLPVAPLDGSHVARAVLEQQFPGDGLRRSLMLSVCVAVLMAIYAIVKMKQPYVCMMFAYLAYNSFAALQAWSHRGGWGR